MTVDASISRRSIRKTSTMSLFSRRLVVVVVPVLVCLGSGRFPGGSSALCRAWAPPTTAISVPIPISMRDRSMAGTLGPKTRIGRRQAITEPMPMSQRTMASAEETATKAPLRYRNNRRRVSLPLTVLKSASSEDIEDSLKKEPNDGCDGTSTCAPAPFNATAAAEASSSSSAAAAASSPGSERHYTSDEKFTNLVFLTATFGYALYTILSIDGGMARGWSASEIAMRIPLDNWGAYESYLANKPILTKTLINVIIYLLGDWLSQTAFQSKNLLEFDIRSTLRNGWIGLCFGPFVHGYYEFSDAILPPENGLATRLQKILMDQTVYLTVKCSVYISAVGLLSGDDWESVRQTVREKIGGIVATAWKFWPLVHCVTYSVIPAQHRVLWVNSVDLVWNAILSSAARQDPESASELAADGGDAQRSEKNSVDPVIPRGSDENRKAVHPLVVVSSVAATAPVIVLPDESDVDFDAGGFLTTALCVTNEFGGPTNTTSIDSAVCVEA